MLLKIQVVLRTGLLGSLPRTVGSTNVLRLATGLDLVINLSKLSIDDSKREGLPVSVTAIIFYF